MPQTAKKSSRRRNYNRMGTFYQRNDGRWEGKIQVGKDPLTGRRIRKSVYGATQQEVLEAAEELKLKVFAGTWVATESYTVKQWIEIYTKEYTANLKPLALRSLNTIFTNHVIPALGTRKLTDLQQIEIQQFINALSAPKERDGKGLSPKTVKNIHGVFHKALECAVVANKILKNPAARIILPKAQKPEINALSSDQIEKFLYAIQGRKFERVFKLALMTGMRESEILGLTWDCVDFNRQSITVRQQLQQDETKGKFGYYIANSTKTNKSRTIPISQSMGDLLKAQQTEQQQAKALFENAWGNSWDLVFTNELGEPLSRRTVLKNIKKVMSDIGCPKATFHDLRHTYATHLTQLCGQPETVQKMLGHFSASFTMDTYVHSPDETRRVAASKFDNFVQTIENRKKS